MEEELTCSVCLELFEDPLLLPCSHTFCKRCIRGTLKHGSGSVSKSLDCPACRRTVRLDPLAGVQSLPSNLSLINVIKAFKDERDNCLNRRASSDIDISALCSKHEDLPITLYCSLCSEGICTECEKSVHSKNHTIKPIAMVRQEYQDQVVAVLKDINGQVSALESRQQLLSDAISGIMKYKTESEEDVDQVFRVLRALLQCRQQNMKASLQHKVSSLTQPLNIGIEKCRTLKAQIHNKIIKFKDIRNHTNSSHKIKTLKKFLEELNSFLTFDLNLALKDTLPVGDVPQFQIEEGSAMKSLHELDWKKMDFPPKSEIDNLLKSSDKISGQMKVTAITTPENFKSNFDTKSFSFASGSGSISKKYYVKQKTGPRAEKYKQEQKSLLDENVNIDVNLVNLSFHDQHIASPIAPESDLVPDSGAKRKAVIKPLCSEASKPLPLRGEEDPSTTSPVTVASLSSLEQGAESAPSSTDNASNIESSTLLPSSIHEGSNNEKESSKPALQVGDTDFAPYLRQRYKESETSFRPWGSKARPSEDSGVKVNPPASTTNSNVTMRKAVGDVASKSDRDQVTKNDGEPETTSQSKDARNNLFNAEEFRFSPGISSQGKVVPSRASFVASKPSAANTGMVSKCNPHQVKKLSTTKIPCTSDKCVNKSISEMTDKNQRQVMKLKKRYPDIFVNRHSISSSPESAFAAAEQTKGNNSCQGKSRPFKTKNTENSIFYIEDTQPPMGGEPSELPSSYLPVKKACSLEVAKENPEINCSNDDGGLNSTSPGKNHKKSFSPYKGKAMHTRNGSSSDELDTPAAGNNEGPNPRACLSFALSELQQLTQQIDITRPSTDFVTEPSTDVASSEVDEAESISPSKSDITMGTPRKISQETTDSSPAAALSELQQLTQNISATVQENSEIDDNNASVRMTKMRFKIPSSVDDVAQETSSFKLDGKNERVPQFMHADTKASGKPTLSDPVQMDCSTSDTSTTSQVCEVTPIIKFSVGTGHAQQKATTYKRYREKKKQK